MAFGDERPHRLNCLIGLDERAKARALSEKACDELARGKTKRCARCDDHQPRCWFKRGETVCLRCVGAARIGGEDIDRCAPVGHRARCTRCGGSCGWEGGEFCRKCKETDRAQECGPEYDAGFCVRCDRIAVGGELCERCVFNASHPNCDFEEYKQMFAAQDRRCAICGSTDPGGGNRRMCVDHSHVTGKVRGLLCVQCNAGIGMLRDDPAVVDRAATYLRKHGAGV